MVSKKELKNPFTEKDLLRYFYYTKTDKELMNLLKVEYGPMTIYLNLEMIIEQKRYPYQIEFIKKLHLERLKIFEKMELTDDKKELKNLNKAYEANEYRLQFEWGFKKDKNFHYWWEVPKCRCPKMDNRERWGTKYRIISEACLVHGSIIKKNAK